MDREHDDLSRHLDGELDLEALPEDLRREAEAFARLVAPLRDERVTLPPSVHASVMASVRSSGRARWRRAADAVYAWVTTPKTLRLRPATVGVAVAVALAVLVLVRPRVAGPPGLNPATTTVTRFVFVAPGARSVAVTGDFVAWDPDGVLLHDARGNGVWVAEVALEPGVHHYVFIVDGSEWLPDPNASQVDDGFGQVNSVLLVAPRSSS